MKSLFAFGFLFFALSFCGITDKLKEKVAETSKTTDSKTNDNSTKTDSKSEDVEKAELTAKQKEILDGGKDVNWDEQGISWTLPAGWNKMDVKKEMFNYGSPKTGFLIGSISVMPGNFPAETSLDATYTSSLEQLKNGKYENVRWLEIEGVKGVEWVEAMPEEKSSPRRHQWLAYRTYQGQNQMLNIMLTTNGNNFDGKKDTFAAILYSMKINK